jgi:hypothetical protein
MPKPLPASILSPNKKKVNANGAATEGIILGDLVRWNPSQLRNGHGVIIGTSGSGKTQTIKAIAYELPNLYPEIKRVVIDFHGDQALPEERCYHLNMESPYGVNPLQLDLDKKGGGPGLQAIAVAATIKKALVLGVNQEGLLIEILQGCYAQKGIINDDFSSWTKTPPTFADVQKEILSRIEDGCKESQKLALKLAATFQYGILNKSQPNLDHPLIRFDLSALGKVPGLGAIATEAILKQLMDTHRLMGEVDKSPRTFVFVDEAKEIQKSQSICTIAADGRKYGLSSIIGSQRDTHISDDVLANSALKIVLSVDQTEVARVARRYRFAPNLVAQLQPLEALIRLNAEGHRCKIKPYYERIAE